MIDLSNMSMQDIFDKAYLGLAKQGFRQSLDSVSCRYNGPNGTHCAIGHLGHIPPAYEGDSVRQLIDAGLIEGWEYDAELRRFLVRLQSCHDRSHIPANMQVALEALAHDYSLTIPEIPS